MFMIPALTKMAEDAVNPFIRVRTSAAETDGPFYDVAKLTKGERAQAMVLRDEQSVPEGSICIVYPDNHPRRQADTFTLVPRREKRRGMEGATQVVADIAESADFDAVVIPGCASSPLGAAAFAKAVAEIGTGHGKPGKPVASIVCGQGAFDMWVEAASGGMLMAPMANMLSVFDKALEISVKRNPFTRLPFEIYVTDYIHAIHEAATLYALLKARLENGRFETLRMIVSHGKGNWAVLTVLLKLELLLERNTIEIPRDIGRPIDIVTFGNPVSLPDMNPRMKELFRYHQYVSDFDQLAHKCLWKTWSFNFDGPMVDPRNKTLEFAPGKAPGEHLFAKTEHHPRINTDAALDRDPDHHLQTIVHHPETGELLPMHMPMEKILPMIRAL